jgi:CMP-N-acetylneuraminic acid synthetase
MSITAFLPCRSGSERVPRKNIRKFSHYSNGLIELKLEQLIKSNSIGHIVVSTNDQIIIDYVNSINSKKISIDIRDESLCSSDTSTDELISYVPSIINTEYILWTHVTSPFILARDYDLAIDMFYDCLNQGFDSLMTVSAIRSFLWDKNAPINYDRALEKWPRTQTIEPLFEVNSGIFINSYENYIELNDRIGKKPYLYELTGYKGMDIDWESDFELALQIMKTTYSKDNYEKL